MPTYQVNDMTCGHCVATITKAVKALDAAAQVDTDLASHQVSVQSNAAPARVEAAIRDAGFTPQPVGA
ncbi:MAG: heavy-metal-associated domain-containing protein [Burkholderiales bacterium]|nr:heavy-metal-associated domain-containing protein [Burkholderiales bacterium]